MSYPFRIGFLALTCVALMPSCALARSPFDGIWSVVVVTHSGSCDRATRVGVRIFGGNISPEGSGFDLRGQVSRNGTLRAVISAGSQSASGSGRLTGSRGHGVWRGHGNSGYCAGTWEAARR
jgi:hypothetical protein